MNQYGVDDDSWQQIINTCLQHAKVNAVILYGSRARGDFTHGSDIDLAIDAPSMTSQDFSVVWHALDDLPIIYTFDVVHLQHITNEHLRQAIDKEGIVFSKK